MARSIPKTRLGRALVAGIPIALLIAGVEIVRGGWEVEHLDGHLMVTGTPEAIRDFVKYERAHRPKLRLSALKSADQGKQTMVIDVPDHYAVEDLLVTVSEAAEAGLSFSYDGKKGSALSLRLNLFG